jgi:signal transduction histidine kinase/ActR/RegA family two-component response regulator
MLNGIIFVTGLAVVLVLAVVCVRLYLLLLKAAAAQSELTAANKDMVATIKAKSEFLVAMSYEIRTPMNALTGFAEILAQRSIQNCGAELKEETEGILDLIKKSSQDLLSIINEVFDYIKIDANLLEIESVPMSIERVIHDICCDEKPSVIAKHLDLSVKYSGEIPRTILSDPVRIRQILLHLINNAIKFTNKGTITVVCEILDGAASASGQPAVLTKETQKPQDSFSDSLKQLKISVIDTGIGISPSHLQELFKPFKYKDSSTSLQFKRGMGLGLNIAMRLATLMDGTITVESTPGQGSVFSLLLNVYVPEDTQQELRSRHSKQEAQYNGSQLREGLDIRMPKKSETMIASDKNRPLKNVRVLVVEDMVVNQVIIATLLRDAGAKVELADNGAMGVQKIMQDMDNGLVFDVVLMDMQMPVMDGYEATAYLRKYDYTRPIIAVTARALTGDMEKTLEAGCDDYVAKPVDNQQLIEMIKKYAGVD